ncbi:MAG: DnaD domain protein [Lachnospiraceae bacterium]|nr:DnaD domain protein [Lachnospiraceae bacterium]
MSRLTLSSTPKTEYTMISNVFIDRYMPRANGTYVKVYLCLLRLLASARTDSTLAAVADFLDETEKDIERALKYWEAQKLMRLERDGSAEITGVVFLEPVPDTEENSGVAFSAGTADAASDGKSAQRPYDASDTAGAPARRACDALGEAGNSAQQPSGAPGTVRREGSGISAKRRLPEKPDYSEAQIEVLTSLDEVKRMLTELQRVTARLLRGSDLNFVLYLYETVGFPADLIVYLYEYCASKNKTSLSYIESVAIAWAESGIDTVEKAKTETAVYSNSYSIVNRAFGLNRAPGSIELQYIHRWTGVYGFDAAVIEEACNRTILAVAKPDFKYADRILERWHAAGVHKKEDIAVLDAEFAKQNARREAGRQEKDSRQAAASAAANNRFNAFPQRKYSSSDYSAMEQQLLGSR